MKKLILSLAVIFAISTVSVACGEEGKKACCKKGAEKACAGKEAKTCSKGKSACCKSKMKASEEVKAVEAAPAK